MLALTAHRLFEAFSDGQRTLQPVKNQLRGQKVLLMLHSDGHNPPSEMLLNDLRIWLKQNGARDVILCSCQNHDHWRCNSDRKLKDRMTCNCACHRQLLLKHRGEWKEVA